MSAKQRLGTDLGNEEIRRGNYSGGDFKRTQLPPKTYDLPALPCNAC